MFEDWIWFSQYIFTFGNIVFTVSLIPTILKNKELNRCDIPYKTSIVTGCMVYLFVLGFVIINQLFSAIASFLTGTSWAIIACQRYYYSYHDKINKEYVFQ